MTQHVTCPWESVSWEESTYLEEPDGPPLIRVDVHRKFVGGPFEGESHGVLLCARPRKGSAGFVASEYVRASLGERTGTFVVQHMAAMGPGHPGTPERLGIVVPDSGTGGWTGMTGECWFTHRDGRSVMLLSFDVPGAGAE